MRRAKAKNKEIGACRWQLSLVLPPVVCWRGPRPPDSPSVYMQERVLSRRALVWNWSDE